jgi:hypothetical protein
MKRTVISYMALSFLSLVSIGSGCRLETDTEEAAEADIDTAQEALMICSDCPLETDTEEAAEADIDTAQEALSGDLIDSTGTITVRVKTCGWSQTLPAPTATCSVDSDFVLIGGGAEIVGSGTPNAVLTGSFPGSDLTTWTAKSKDHQMSYPHKLRAYAIGLRLKNVPSTTLRNYMYFSASPLAYGQHPNTTASLPPGYRLIGGGAKANWVSNGLLLTASYPDGFQWVAAAKDHGLAEIGSVQSFAIGITAGTIPGFGSITTTASSAFVWASSGHASEHVYPPTGWLLSSIGGRAEYGNYGRLLAGLIPAVDTPNVAKSLASSKDHYAVDSGNTWAYAISIQRP